jgi:hypothetical protein
VGIDGTFEQKGNSTRYKRDGDRDGGRNTQSEMACGRGWDLNSWYDYIGLSRGMARQA